MKKFLKKFFSEMFIARYITLYVTYIKNTRLSVYAKKGKHTHLFGPLTLDPRYVELDDYTRLSPGVRVINWKGKLIVKKFTAVAAGTTIVANDHVPTVGLPQYMSNKHINDVTSTVVIEEDVWIGTECILLSRCRIGRGAIVGAGSVVTKPVPPYAVVAGNPARVMAARFSLEQILKHEQILYPPHERTPKEELEKLFATVFKGLKTLGTSEISAEDYAFLEEEKKKNGIVNYENE